MLNRQHRREALGRADIAEELVQDRRCIAAFGCAFLGLIAATVLYAAISAERGCVVTDGRGASEEVLAGVAFAFALYTLLFAAVQLVSAAALGAHIRFIVAVLTPPIIVVFVLSSLDDLALSLAGPPQNPLPHRPIEPMWTPSSRSLWDSSQSLLPWLALAVFVACAVIWWCGRSVRRDDGTPARLMDLAMTCLPYSSLALIMFAVWQSMSLSTLDPTAHISPRLAWGLVGVSTALVIAQSACLSLERGEERDHQTAPTQPSGQGEDEGRA
jgi:hypothetical protein